jgi:hypothetical protein
MKDSRVCILKILKISWNLTLASYIKRPILPVTRITGRIFHLSDQKMMTRK